MRRSTVVTTEHRHEYKQVDLLSVNLKLSESLLLNIKIPKFQLYHGEYKLHFDELMIRSEFSSAISLKQQSTGRHVAPL